MNTIQLKQELIHSISGIEDNDLLIAIKTILDHKKRESIIELTDDLERDLLFASDDWKKGNVVSQSEMDQKVGEWLCDK